jgi:two-component system CheB/CheR fusion protein
VRIDQNGSSRTFSVEVIPLKSLRERCFLVLFDDAEPPAAGAEPAPRAAGRRKGAAAAKHSPRERSARRIFELESELEETRDYVRAVEEQSEAANEELQAANEEVQSGNEELQSINEELETSKEELESANEELTTLNEEMSHRNAELSRLNADLVNVQTATAQSILLVGRDLTIRRFSARAEKQFDLLAADVGAPLSRIRHALGMPDVEALVRGAIEGVRPVEREVQDRDGHWFSLRVRPYLTLDDRVDGAVLLLVDIDDLKRAQAVVAAARDYADGIVDAVREPLLVLDRELRVERANAAFYRTFRATREESVGRVLYDLGNGHWSVPRLRELLGGVASGSTSVEDFLVEHEFEGLGRRSMLLNARRVLDASRELVLLAIEDVTDRQRAERQLQQSVALLEERAAELDRFNRVAVGRELRMIELKREVNELCERHGEAARYPLDFAQEPPGPGGAGFDDDGGSRGGSG